MVAGRIEAQSPGLGLSVPAGLWLIGAPLGADAAELARVPGVSGIICGPKADVRALCDAFGAKGLVSAPGGPARRNLVGQVPARETPPKGKAFHARGICSPARLDASLEAWLGGLEGQKGELTSCLALFGVDAIRLDRTFDAIALQRMDGAPTDFIRAAYRLLLGRVGTAVAAVCRRRLATAVNGARFKALARRGAPRPVLLVEAAAAKAAEFAAPDTLVAVPYEAAVSLPPLPAGSALDEAYDASKGLLDKLANYQIDLDVIAGELEAA